MSNKELISYLRSFAISKEIFNIKIKESNIDKKASILVMDDEYVGNTFDNLEKINILIKKS